MVFPDEKDMRILVVDDSPNMLRTVVNMLRMMGFKEIFRADNGESALARLRSEKIHMVLSDWNMPEMNGIELLRAVREDDALRELPFLMITGETDQQTVAEAAEVDVDGYLLKPFTHEKLKARIDDILTRKKNPDPVEVHLALAKVFTDARQYDRAMDELREGLKKSPRSPRLSHAVGEVCESQGDLDKARKMYLRSIEFGFQFLKGHESAARVYQAMGQLDAAAEHLQKAVTISPNHLDRQLNLSKVLIKTGDKTGAQEVLRIVLTLADKKRAEVAREVGEAFLEAGMAAEAQEVFRQALEAAPEDVNLYNRMGIALRQQSKFKEAIQNYRKALTIDPENEVLYYNLGRACHDAGDLDAAKASMKRALTIAPDFKEPKDYLARLAAH